jgi:hypothetical protein
MNIGHAHILIESFRKELLGAPDWHNDKRVFEYRQQSIETVAILKLIRATQGLATLEVLCNAGLFIDMGASIRCIFDAVEEIYFLLERHPAEPSGHVQQFVKNFFESTIDNYLNVTTHQVTRDKIRSARVRTLKEGHDDATQKLLQRIYVSFCGYTHASYAHIMEIYEGNQDSFNLAGVPSAEKRDLWAEHIELSANAVLMAAAFLSMKLGKKDYFDAFMKATI